MLEESISSLARRLPGVDLFLSAAGEEVSAAALWLVRAQAARTLQGDTRQHPEQRAHRHAV